jgi:hypothetical protein
VKIKKIIAKILPLITVIILLTGANAACGYLLSKRDQHLVKIAFMNGSIEMLALDLEDIQRLKDNETLFRQLVEKTADRYVKKVQLLNQTGNRPVIAARGSKYHTPY